MKPNPCVILAIDPGEKSGAALMLLGKLIFSTAVKDSPEARAFVVKLAMDAAEGAGGLPVRVVIEKFGAGMGAHGHFGARTLAGIERRVGAWRESAQLAGVKLTEIVRVYPQTWRSRVLGKGSGSSESMKALARVYVAKRFDIESPSEDEAEAICIAVWATTAPEIAKTFTKATVRRVNTLMEDVAFSTIQKEVPGEAETGRVDADGSVRASSAGDQAGEVEPAHED